MKTQWIFVFFPIKSFLTKYNLVVQTFEEQNVHAFTKANLVKFIELFMAMVLEGNKDKRCLFVLSFIKNNFKNMFTTHLDLVVCMYA